VVTGALAVALVLNTVRRGAERRRVAAHLGGRRGVVVGFAAQKSIGSLLAGLQLSVTQPIRIADQVTVEGEFGTTATCPSPGLECEARLL